MAAKFSEKAQSILKFLQANVGCNLIASDIAQHTGMTVASANGVIAGLQRGGYVQRVELEGYEKKVIRLTEEGKTVNPMEEK